MLKTRVLWAVGFVGSLVSAVIASQQPATVLDANGAQHILPPNKSAMWPPHRPHPTSKKFKRGYRAPARTINEAMKRGGAPVHVLDRSKYLHASRTNA
jgi:hypothetical protein